MTLNTIAVGFDGSAGSAAALRWAQALADGSGAKVMAVGAFTHPPSELTQEHRERMLADYSNRLRERWLPPSVSLTVRSGDPREVITAFDGSADLLVLGRSGHGSEPGPGHIGSVVEHVAHHSRWPLAIVTDDDWFDHPPIVLGLDGSPQAAAATAVCADLARAFDATVVAVVVRYPLRAGDSVLPDATHQAVLAELDGWAAPLHAAGVKVEATVEVDRDPATALLRVADRHGAGALVIGTRGIGGFSGLRVGGVAMRTLHRAHRTLVLVPPISEPG